MVSPSSLLDVENSLGHLSKIKIPRALPKPTESASLRGGIWEAEFLDKCPMQLSAAARQDRGVLGDGKKENLAFDRKFPWSQRQNSGPGKLRLSDS